MVKRTLVLRFPPHLVNEAITYRLVKDYGLAINILSARVKPQEEGNVVIGVEGEKTKIEEGVDYLKRLGVKIQPLVQDILWNQEECTHCTLCIPLCPTEAFILDRKSMEVSFDKERCIACGLCVKVCPYHALELLLG